MKLSGAMFYVKDLSRMAAFYQAVLGREPMKGSRSDNWVEFAGEGWRLGLHAIPEEIASGINISSPPEARANTPLKLIFEVEDVSSECQRLEALGATAKGRPWGACDVIDPEGNIFQIQGRM